MKKIAVIYWTGTGNTKSMADIVCNSLENLSVEYKLYEASEFNSSLIEEYDGFAFGCPAMGAEELEPDEFEPFYSSIEGELNGKNIALFGSYEWADGEWMKTWEERAKGSGANVFEGQGLIIYDKPDDEGIAKCKAFGERFAK